MAPDASLDITQLQHAIEAAARATGPEPHFPRLELERLCPTLREATRVDARPVLIGRTPYERFWVIVNRLIRSVVGPGVEPGVEAQNRLNARMVEILMNLANRHTTLQAELIRFQAEHHHERS